MLRTRKLASIFAVTIASVTLAASHAAAQRDSTPAGAHARISSPLSPDRIVATVLRQTDDGVLTRPEGRSDSVAVPIDRITTSPVLRQQSADTVPASTMHPVDEAALPIQHIDPSSGPPSPAAIGLVLAVALFAVLIIGVSHL